MTQGVGKSEGPTQRTESDGGRASASETDSQVFLQIPGQRPSIHQIHSDRNMDQIHALCWLQEPIPSWTKGTRPKPQMERTMTQHGRRRGQGAQKTSSDTKANSREGKHRDSSTSVPSSGPTTPPYICLHTFYVRIWTRPPFCRSVENPPS